MDNQSSKRALPYFDGSAQSNAPKRTKCSSPSSINFILNNFNEDSKASRRRNDQDDTTNSGSYKTPPPYMIASIAPPPQNSYSPPSASPIIAHPQPLNSSYYPHQQVSVAPPMHSTPQHFLTQQSFVPHSFTSQHYQPPPPPQSYGLPSYPQLLAHSPQPLRSHSQSHHLHPQGQVQAPLHSHAQHQPQSHPQMLPHTQVHHLDLAQRSMGQSPQHLHAYPPNSARPDSPSQPLRRHSYQPTPVQAPPLQFSPSISSLKHPSSHLESVSPSGTPSTLQQLQTPKIFKANKVNTRYISIGEDLLKMRQNDAARRIGIAPSTFSKRWRQTLPDRKWPFRQNVKLEKNIKTLHKFEAKGHDVTMEMDKLLRQKDENLKEALILIQNDDVSEEYTEAAIENDQDDDKNDDEDE